MKTDPFFFVKKERIHQGNLEVLQIKDHTDANNKNISVLEQVLPGNVLLVLLYFYLFAHFLIKNI
jgi:hypothetical protein